MYIVLKLVQLNISHLEWTPIENVGESNQNFLLVAQAQLWDHADFAFQQMNVCHREKVPATYIIINNRYSILANKYIFLFTPSLHIFPFLQAGQLIFVLNEQPIWSEIPPSILILHVASERVRLVVADLNGRLRPLLGGSWRYQNRTNGSIKLALQFLKYLVKKLIIKYMILMKSSNKHKGWCDDQDRIISELVPKYGTKNWAQIAEQLHLVYGYTKKTGKQCRQRWHNHLDPSIVKKSWTRAEEDTLFQEQKKHGNKWTVIAEKLPGRTDNSIKNHFYSTVRKSLRRISKFMGSKNSTSKMRQIKPSTLSKIFKIAEKTSEETSTSSQQHDLVNCSEIAQSLMDFARWKLADKKYVIDQEDIKNFQKILEQMVKINNIYQDQKLLEAKMKKEKLLQKNFDQAASSQSQENSSDEAEAAEARSEIAGQLMQNQSRNQLFLTRSKRKVKPPSQFKIEFGDKKEKKKQSQPEMEQLKQFDIKQEEYQVNVVMRSLLTETLGKNKINQDYGQMQEFCQKENEHHGNETQSNKFQFLVELEAEDESLRQMQLSGSPGLKNTPMALTPKTYEFMKQLPYQTLKNQDCNSTVNKIVHDIKRNTNHEFEAPQRPMLILSPLSAFKQYS